MVSLGFVVDGDGVSSNATRVLGALYGAGATATLDDNRVYAAWLQRHVLFVGNDTPPTVWGATPGSERAEGPNTLTLATNHKAMSGKFLVYDSDFSLASGQGTLLYTSADVTVAQGDVWAFSA
jgi:hypothetical protein